MKHLAKLLSPLSTSEYTAKSTKDFIEKLRTFKVPKEYQMVSFDVKALFTYVSLEYTINLVLKRIYENHEISMSITRNEMREILLLRETYILHLEMLFVYKQMVPLRVHHWASISWNINCSFRKVL